MHPKVFCHPGNNNIKLFVGPSLFERSKIGAKIAAGSHMKISEEQKKLHPAVPHSHKHDRGKP